MKKYNFVILLVLLSSLMPLSLKAASEIKRSFYNTMNISNGEDNREPSGERKLKNNNRNTSKLPSEFTTDFSIKNGLIYVNANLNGKVRSFLLDSGLGTNLILNSDAKFVENLTGTDICINGMGSGKCREVETSWINTFNWKGIKLSNTEVTAMSLSHLGQGDGFAGIIGFNTFKNYQLTFDFQHGILKADTKKNIEKEVKENGKLISTIPFELKDHMPVFEVEINGKKYKMGLDTGASVNVMNNKYLSDFSDSVSNIREVSMKGFGGKSTVQRGSIKETKIGGLNYDNMDYNFDNSSLNSLNKEYKYGIDGIIGYEFLKKYITVIDFKSKEIRIYDGVII